MAEQIAQEFLETLLTRQIVTSVTARHPASWPSTAGYAVGNPDYFFEVEHIRLLTLCEASA
jgi:hypothetical protein